MTWIKSIDRALVCKAQREFDETLALGRTVNW